MRWLPLFLALLGSLLISSGLASSAYEKAVATAGSAPLPLMVAEFPLVEELTGSQAAQNIAHLHRQTFPLSGAAVGNYGDGLSRAPVWVSASPVLPMAARMLRAMEQAMGSGSSPFVPGETRQAGSRPIDALTGLGQRHFYFRFGNLVIWLAAGESRADAALADVLAFHN